MSSDQLKKLMSISTQLSDLNYQRFQSFSTVAEDNPAHYPAIFYFQGDVYQSLKADTFDAETLSFANDHLRILSGSLWLITPLRYHSSASFRNGNASPKP